MYVDGWHIIFGSRQYWGVYILTSKLKMAHYNFGIFERGLLNQPCSLLK
jgi:hypothetical protein